MIADEYESERMETGEKSVSFSTEDEILEIESRQTLTRLNRNRNRKNGVKARLGLRQNLPQSASLIHRTRKVVKLKHKLRSDSMLKTAGLRSDQLLLKKSIKSRLNLKRTLKSEPEVKKLVNQIGRVSLSSRLGSTNGTNGAASASSSSVFDRLGFSKK